MAALSDVGCQRSENTVRYIRHSACNADVNAAAVAAGSGGGMATMTYSLNGDHLPQLPCGLKSIRRGSLLSETQVDISADAFSFREPCALSRDMTGEPISTPSMYAGGSLACPRCTDVRMGFLATPTGPIALANRARPVVRRAPPRSGTAIWR